jgi:hypothetical protein
MLTKGILTSLYKTGPHRDLKDFAISQLKTCIRYESQQRASTGPPLTQGVSKFAQDLFCL